MSIRYSFLLLLALVGAARAAAPPDRKAELEATLRKLEKEIAAVRGLAFKKPVVAKIIPRPKGADKGVQGYYSVKEKTLYVYDDVRGSYQKGVLIHEMVHALQDQHFGLKKLHAASFDGERELAMAALVEGDATYTMIELLQKEQPAVAKMLAMPLEKATNLQNAFLYAQGARYVAALKKRGGWEAINVRYSFLRPTSTASILHPGENISPLNLGPGERLGEFGLIRLLHEHPATRADAVALASGWRGDRAVKDGKASARVVAFATPAQAKALFAALPQRYASEKAGWKKAADEAGEAVWAKAGAGVHAFLLRDKRVWHLAAPDDKAYKALREKVEGPPTLVVHDVKGKKAITFGELTDRLLAADVVCVGEDHDSELHHQVQLQIIAALYARDRRLGVGMEMFQRPYQKALDRYVAGKTDEETLLEDSEYLSRWGYDWALYRPIVDFCRRNAVPVAALNAPRELTRRISAVGYDKLNADEKKQVGPVDFHVKAHRAHHYESLAAMHGQAKVPEERKERMYQVMTVWDEYMADSAARFLRERKLRRVVVLAGSGHVLKGFGIPDRAAKKTGGKVLTVRVEVDGDPAKVLADAGADYVVFVK